MTNLTLELVSAGSQIDLGDELDSPLDTRQGVDPIANAVTNDLTSAASLSSVGQVSNVSDVSAGQIGVVGDYTIATNGTAADSILQLDVQTRGEIERPV